jgi:hypothetical protein
MTNRVPRCLTPVAAFIALALVLTPKIGWSQGTYTCMIDTAGGQTCDGWNVIVSNTGGSTRLVTVVLKGASAQWQFMQVRVRSCDPQGYSLNIGDSSTNDGGAGDYGSTKHDAELQVFNSAVTVFQSQYGNPSVSVSSQNLPWGCSVQEYRMFDHWVFVDPDVSVNGNASAWLSYFFEFPDYPSWEPDSEDMSLVEEKKMYLGLNRVVYLGANPSRTGSGTAAACIFLSIATDSSLTENRPISGCPF